MKNRLGFSGILNYKPEKEKVGTEDIKRFSDNTQETEKEKDYLEFINRDLFLRINFKNKNHKCLIDDSITSIENSICLINLLNNMKDDETIEIDINSVGGSIVVMGLICSAMLRCKGKVITKNIGYAYSAGSMIWACGKELKLAEFSHSMFHMAITEVEGRTDEKSRELGHSSDTTRDMLFFCKNRGILTEEECHAIMNKKEDVYISYEKMSSRLEKINSFTSLSELF